MGQADEHLRHTARLRQCRAFAMQDDVRRAAGVPANLHVQPAQFVADAGAERFGDGFLRGKPRGEMEFRELHAPAIRDFAGQKTTVEKPVAKLLQRLPDASSLNNVQSRAGNVHSREYELKAIRASSRRWRKRTGRAAGPVSLAPGADSLS